MDEGIRVLQSVFEIPQGIVNMPALLSTQKKCVQQIFIALKNPPPWPGLNLWPIRPVASTPTTTPPRQLM
jgi:hypothetical protein